MKFETGRVFSRNPRCDGSATDGHCWWGGGGGEGGGGGKRENLQKLINLLGGLLQQHYRSFGKIPKSD